MNDVELKALDRAAAQHAWANRTRTQNLNRVLDNAAGAAQDTCTRCGGAHSLSRCPWPQGAGITRSPCRCTVCGNQLGQPHATWCRFAGGMA